MKTKKPYILCVDDDVMNLTLLELYLADEYEVKMVEDGKACIDEVSERKPEVILLDLMMPVMDGKAVFKHLKASPDTQSIIVIILSAESYPDDVQAMYDMGVDGYLTKPFSGEQLLELLNTCLP